MSIQTPDRYSPPGSGHGAFSARPLVDSHCHLADARLRDEADEAIARSRLAGVTAIVSVGASGPIDTDRLAVEIAERNQDVYAVVGVHPHDASTCSDIRISQLRELAASPKVVGIGESGLDFYYMHSPPAVQEASLRRHFALAHLVNKPIVIHCRDAEKQLAGITEEAGMPARGGVIHCFTGDPSSAQMFLELGFYISFSGILTFRNAAQVREAARLVPLDRLLVETDAPYLAPEPYRGKRNEPAYVARTLAVLAEVRGLSADVLARTTAENAGRLFGFTI